MKNPFLSFSHVPNSKELLDIAFKRAMKSSAQVSKNAPILLKAKKKEFKRIKVAIKELIDRILAIIKKVPIIDDLPDFYRELASLLVDVDELKFTHSKQNRKRTFKKAKSDRSSKGCRPNKKVSIWKNFFNNR